MLKLSQKCTYALRALFELALHADGEPRKIADIAEAQAIPPPFLQGIMRELRTAGLTESKRGKEGGYRLARPAEAISMGDVIRAIDGDMALVECASGAPDESCRMRRACPFIPVYREAMGAVNQVFDKATLAMLVERYSRQERTQQPAPAPWGV